MGYYTSVGICLSAKKEKIAELRSRVEELRSACQNDENHWFWYYDDIEIRADGAIEFSDCYRKWYEEEQFYELLSPYVMEGYIEGQGEHFGDVWRVCFDGRGGFKKQVAVFVDEDAGMSAEAGAGATPPPSAIADKTSTEPRLSCPFCGCIRFLRYAEEEVEMVYDGECVVDELCGGWTEYTYRCKECGKEVLETDLLGRQGHDASASREREGI